MIDHDAIGIAAQNASEEFDSSDPDQVNQARIKAGRAAVERTRFVQAVMDLKEGRAWIYSLLVRCELWQSGFAGGDPYAMAFNCGRREIGLRVLADIQAAAPGQYMAMIQEANNPNG